MNDCVFLDVKDQPHLENCPFCGSSVELKKYKYPSGDIDYCIFGYHDNGCFFEEVVALPTCEDKDTLIKAWNMRFKGEW